MNINGGNANVFRVPQFLRAPTPEGLVRLMLLNNIKNGIEFRYFDIQKDQRGWIAWFNVEVDKNALVKEAMDKNTGEKLDGSAV